MKKPNVESIRGYNFWVFVWDTFEILYDLTGLRWQTPIEYFFPNFGRYIFGKIIGQKGEIVSE